MMGILKMRRIWKMMMIIKIMRIFKMMRILKDDDDYEGYEDDKVHDNHE